LDQYHITDVFHEESDFFATEKGCVLHCPVCQHAYQHTEPPFVLDSRDTAGTVWSGRGNVLVIPVWGECGSSWQLCLGFHKGSTVIFVRMVLSCYDAHKVGIHGMDLAQVRRKEVASDH